MKLQILFTLLTFATINTEADISHCQRDCRKPLPYRPVGPTRPWHSNDLLGNNLDKTLSHPYDIVGSVALELKFNVTFAVEGFFFEGSRDYPLDEEKEVGFALDAIKSSLRKTDVPFEWKIFNSTKELKEGEYPTGEQVQSLMVPIEIFLYLDGILDDTNTSLVGNPLLDVFETSLNQVVRIENLEDKLNYSFATSQAEYSQLLRVQDPNPYSEFCEIGCSLFYASPSDPLYIDECTDACDKLYKYNISVGYSDLAEVTRYECRDGCQIALKRCQPGYYCSQVNLIRKNDDSINDQLPGFDGEGKKFNGGYMAHCAAGTYRDVAFDKVEECTSCPPGQFREDIKGTAADGCSKCPAGTYNGKHGSATILDCIRCPTGTFTNEPGSARCKCITPSSCATNQLINTAP